MNKIKLLLALPLISMQFKSAMNIHIRIETYDAKINFAARNSLIEDIEYTNTKSKKAYDLNYRTTNRISFLDEFIKSNTLKKVFQSRVQCINQSVDINKLCIPFTTLYHSDKICG